jgi:two-component system chemotaxis response regulator CheB
MSSSLRVVVVDDSPICRGLLKEILEADGDVTVVAEAADGYAAISVARTVAPDLITMDLDMPGPGGLEVIESIMARSPVPILVITDAPLGEGGELVFKAIEQGALDLMRKPSGTNVAAGKELRDRVRALARVPVFRHVPRQTSTLPPPAGSMTHKATVAPPPSGRPRAQIVGIAAGPGGSRALTAVLSQLPADLPAAVAVVQHVPSGFNEALVRFLRGSTSLRVEVAPDTAVPCTPGTVFVAPDDRHLVCPREGYIVALHESALGGYLPSATMLFKSMSAAYRDACAGVILSGAGDDGAEGATILRSRGGLTIAEDNHASPADMPRAAVDAGGIDRVLPLALIADTLLSAIDGMLDRRPTP